jgi:hypothetical protein
MSTAQSRKGGRWLRVWPGFDAATLPQGALASILAELGSLGGRLDVALDRLSVSRPMTVIADDLFQRDDWIDFRTLDSLARWPGVEVSRLPEVVLK